MPIRNGKLILAKDINVDKSYNNVLSYTEQQMLSLIQSKQVYSQSNFSFIRQGENRIKVDTTYGTALQANYIAFQNPNYSNKWFFAWITDVKYISDRCSEIDFEVDEFSTWWDYWNPNQCFVLREHTNNDTVGNNLVPEGLEHGEYVMNGDPTRFTPYAPRPVYVINADREPSTDGSGNPTGGNTEVLSINVGGLPMSGGLYFFDNMQTLTNACLTYSRMTGGLDHIKNVYVTTEYCYTGGNIEYGTFELEEYAYYKYKGSSVPVVIDKTISAPTTLNGYQPRNAKLLSAPYQFILLSNGCGSSNQLNYEYFSDRNNITIRSKGVPVVGGSVFAYPINYKSTTDNINEGVIGGKYPTLSWSGDAYTNWLTQNSVNIGVNMANSLLGIGAGAVTGMLTGGVGSAIALGTTVSSVQTVTNQMKEIYNHSIVPNTFSGNVNGGDVMTASKQNELLIWKVSITSEYASRLDSYFDRFGYKTDRLKTPNQTGRRYWNFVQIADGEDIVKSNNQAISVPAKSADTINNIYRKGVTIWHNHDNIGDFSLSNTIV